MPGAARPLLIAYASLSLAALGQEVGSRACAPCHPAIFKSYAQTGMARSAGSAAGASTPLESFDRAAFTHPPAGVSYRVASTPRGFRMAFERPSTGLHGERLLEWFIGSGAIGRSYLFSIDGFLYQAPVSYYSSARAWQVSPGYQSREHVDLTRPVEPACLQCHASRLQPVVGAQNRFAATPFLEPGVSCERCHGPGQAHIANRRAGRSAADGIVNPRKLEAHPRDSVCAQCHLTGAARVATGAGKYVPGAGLSSSLAIFVWSGAAAAVSATGHYERLNQSACKQTSGDRLWCGTCHDPHSQPSAAERVAYYRRQCLTCHQSQPCSAASAARRARNDDCAACHMPKSAGRNIEHIAFTDHGIPRDASAPPSSAPARRTLQPFWGTPSERDTALGYAVAAMTEPSVRREALDRLESAARAQPGDVPVLAQLAQFYDRLGREAEAAALCERILQLDPDHIAAAVNLGSYKAKLGQIDEAMALWSGALERNPAQTGVRVNLAVAQFRSGKLADAEASLRKALEYDPDSAPARKLLAGVLAARQ